jgi:1,4-dihydroxy-6-naphthoate synthase
MTRTIKVAHSPDSDDAFMFYALAEGLVPTGDRRYVHELADIESLNRRALAGELEVTAVSIHAYARVADRYALLPHGASVGDRYGPRLVSRSPTPAEPRKGVAGKRVAVPGLLTTAYLALRLYQPNFEPVVTPFDQIEDAVLDGKVDLGLLIHEGQLTYADRGLHLWADMGEWWFTETDLPLPLGGNVVRRDLGDDVIRAISRDLRASIVYGLQHREAALNHALQYARGLDRARADTFVGMYVNDFTVDYGTRGRKAVSVLLDRAAAAGILPHRVDVKFVEDGEPASSVGTRDR